jgi:hypothetical protein
MDMDRECAEKRCDHNATTRNVGRRILSKRESELDDDRVAVSRKMVGRVIGASENNRKSGMWNCESDGARNIGNSSVEACSSSVLKSSLVQSFAKFGGNWTTTSLFISRKPKRLDRTPKDRLPYECRAWSPNNFDLLYIPNRWKLSELW